ncbi:hypothetical protein LCGC14_2702670 [marine sediment metagenome]|uniref:Uncharacterized protein n=1 Tax=marine sediment metagenome TaxID=412755 RepID=A0A0F8ZF83_9ZZZZ
MKRHTNKCLSIYPKTIDEEIRMEQSRGVEKFGKYNSMHEAYAVIKEELDEFWDSVKENDPDPIELLHVCATTRRACIELCEIARIDMNQIKESE